MNPRLHLVTGGTRSPGTGHALPRAPAWAPIPDPDGSPTNRWEGILSVGPGAGTVNTVGMDAATVADTHDGLVQGTSFGHAYAGLRQNMMAWML